jgi:hypothetical protein
MNRVVGRSALRSGTVFCNVLAAERRDKYSTGTEIFIPTCERNLKYSSLHQKEFRTRVMFRSRIYNPDAWSKKSRLQMQFCKYEVPEPEVPLLPSDHVCIQILSKSYRVENVRYKFRRLKLGCLDYSELWLGQERVKHSQNIQTKLRVPQKSVEKMCRYPVQSQNIPVPSMPRTGDLWIA